MSGLPKSIIKKYGVTKKAWAVYRGKKITHSRGVSMAKKHRSFRRSSGRSDIMSLAGACLVYGAIRKPISNAIAGTGFNLLGGYTTPALLGVGGYFLSKQSGFIGQLGKVAMIYEITGVGSNLLSGFMSGSSPLSSGIVLN